MRLSSSNSESIRRSRLRRLLKDRVVGVLIEGAFTALFGGLLACIVCIALGMWIAYGRDEVVCWYRSNC
jgi:type IV secretory pathway TrbD component